MKYNHSLKNPSLIYNKVIDFLKIIDSKYFKKILDEKDLILKDLSKERTDT